MIVSPNQKFGRLTTVRLTEPHISKSGRKYKQWLCKCDCGNEKTVLEDNLKYNKTTSCGYYQKEVASTMQTPEFIEYRRKKIKKYNTYNLDGEYGVGYTSNGEEFYFDLEDYDLIKDYCWCINGDGYCCARDCDNKKNIYMHRLIINSCQYTDHINHKKYDNRKCNIRSANPTENAMNRANVIGVYYDNTKQKWKAKIQLYNNVIDLGSFDCFEDALSARKDGENKYFCEFSYDNSMREAMAWQ